MNRRMERFDLSHPWVQAYCARRERYYTWKWRISEYWKMLVIVFAFGVFYCVVLS